MRCPNCEHGEMAQQVNERSAGDLFWQCNICKVQAESDDTDPTFDRLVRAAQELSRLIGSALIFKNADEVEEFARRELDMVDRDEVAAIAVQQLHMTPEREGDP